MRLLSTTLLLLALVLSAGCKSEAEQRMSELTAKQKEMIAVLKGVTDVESAKAANTKIKAIAKDVQDLIERSKGLKTTEAERTRLSEKYKPEQQQISKDAQAEMQRIAKIPGAGMELMEGLMELSSAGMRAGATK